MASWQVRTLSFREGKFLEHQSIDKQPKEKESEFMRMWCWGKPFRKWPQNKSFKELTQSWWNEGWTAGGIFVHILIEHLSQGFALPCACKNWMVGLRSYQKSCWMYLQLKNLVQRNLKAKLLMLAVVWWSDFDDKSPKGPPWCDARRPIGGYSCHCRTLLFLALRCWVVSDVRQWIPTSPFCHRNSENLWACIDIYIYI